MTDEKVNSILIIFSFGAVVLFSKYVFALDLLSVIIFAVAVYAAASYFVGKLLDSKEKKQEKKSTPIGLS